MNNSTSPLVRKLAIMYAALAAVGIAVAAFILSFSALWDVATRVWPNRELSWLGPAIVDSTILQATVSLVVVAHASRSTERTLLLVPPDWCSPDEHCRQCPSCDSPTRPAAPRCSCRPHRDNPSGVSAALNAFTDPALTPAAIPRGCSARDVGRRPGGHRGV